MTPDKTLEERQWRYHTPPFLEGVSQRNHLNDGLEARRIQRHPMIIVLLILFITTRRSELESF